MRPERPRPQIPPSLRNPWAFLFSLLLFSGLLVGCAPEERPYPPDRPTTPPPGLSVREWGEKIFRDQGCAGCHDLGGTDGAGGTLVGILGRERRLSTGEVVVADEDYLRTSILSPNAQIVAGRPAVMPSYRDKLGPAEIDALVTFLAQLR